MSKRRLTNGQQTFTDPRSDHKVKFPVVYFLRVADDEFNANATVKVGYSDNYESRLAQHKASKLGRRPVVSELCVVAGSLADEDRVLKYFASFRLPNEDEVFYPEESLLDYIRWLRDQYFVWVRHDVYFPLLESIPIVDSSLWLPNDGRRKIAQRALMFDDPFRLGDRQVTPDDFYTNQIIIERVRDAYGGTIDLDPASHAVANSVIKAQRIFTIADDGLQQTWDGKVWLNPPFGQWERWTSKILQELPNIDELCVLATTRTLTAQYFHALVKAASAMCILDGRIKFWGANASTPTDGHVILYFGPHQDTFIGAMKEIGRTYVNTE